MTEIERCVCGGEAWFDGEWVSCYECGREVFIFGDLDARAKAIASWNSDMRGLRLLRELVEWDRETLLFDGVDDDLLKRVRAWAEDGDRE